jgi:hypothetical protein
MALSQEVLTDAFAGRQLVTPSARTQHQRGGGEGANDEADTRGGSEKLVSALRISVKRRRSGQRGARADRGGGYVVNPSNSRGRARLRLHDL